MTEFAIALIAVPLFFLLYAYLIYPALVWLVGRFGSPPAPASTPSEWPFISITIPAYNEENSISDTIESLLALSYPADRRQILIVSDASTDRTDEIIASYADRGVELLRLPERSGKTAAENAAAPLLRGEIVVNMDATIRVGPDAIQELVKQFQDPTVGVASGRDVSVGDLGREANQGESGYVGYEMGVRALETRAGGIVGASGCFYAIRRPLVQTAFPAELSRDFSSPLIAHRHGYRSVSVNEALCYVPRTRSLQAEYRRKIRTMARGLQTLFYFAPLLDPLRHGRFAWMLLSHKLCRWLVFLTMPLALVGLVLLSGNPVARVLLGLATIGIALGLAGLRWPENRKTPQLLALPGFVVASFLAGFIAWTRAFRGAHDPIWEPTRRPAPPPAAAA
ncbi:MAG TPA: glycosyltransferase [Gemmatimonadales bacterium]|nr:glycosyltransferase [Gemmatimonadales bacterium]